MKEWLYNAAPGLVLIGIIVAPFIGMYLDRNAVPDYEKRCSAKGGHAVVRRDLWMCVDPKMLK